MIELTIERNNHIPIYLQIRRQIQAAIETGTLAPGDALTGEPAIAEQLGISVMTVRQALAQLVAEGYLERRRGKGTFVRDRKVQMHLPYFTSYRSDMRARGFVPSTRILAVEEVEASQRQGRALRVSAGSRLIRLVRLRFADDLPMMLETTWISQRLVPNFVDVFSNDSSYYETLERHYGIRPTRTTQSIEAVSATIEEALHLSVPAGAPVLLIDGTLYDQDDTPVDLTKSLYRADRYKFQIERRISE